VNIPGFVNDLRGQSIVTLSQNELDLLLEISQSVREQDTLMSGKIRILQIDGMVVVQEKTPNGEYLIRKMKSGKEANSFFDERLATYENMWDGCGCKVDYFS